MLNKCLDSYALINDTVYPIDVHDGFNGLRSGIGKYDQPKQRDSDYREVELVPSLSNFIEYFSKDFPYKYHVVHIIRRWCSRVYTSLILFSMSI